jgi:DNA gyrase subunit A
VATDIGTVQPVNIERQMKAAYLDYAMSVITARALPDVRDGLKPVQRRILFAMHGMGMYSDRPYRKSARIVGEVLGKYHPHGDSAVYDAMVRMAQDFSTRYLLVDGQGNFGSIDGDSAAAMRYTEARMTKLSEEMLKDIDKSSVDFGDNFDGSLQEPLVLPAGLPNLLVNGASGIAVGMATSVPPHNLSEICSALTYLLDCRIEGQEVSFDGLMDLVLGPDFPTGGLLYRYRKLPGETEPIDALRKAYATGRGALVVRAKTDFEELSNGRQAIIVTEIPYQVNKSALIAKIADLVRNGRADGISDLRDESDRSGTRIVIELKRTAQPRQLLNQLFKRSALQTTFSVNLLALVDGEPRVLSLQKALGHYVTHREDVITRRTKHELGLARKREHILAGLRIALDNLDQVINTIRNSDTVEAARANLRSRFNLTEEQANAILEMPLRRLAGLERQKIEEEHAQIRLRIEELEGILADSRKVLGLIKEELERLKSEYGDPRRTQVIDGSVGAFSARDLVPEEEVLITLSRRGYIKRNRVASYRLQRKGGRGVNGMATLDDDGIEHILMASTLDRLLLFTDRGRVFSLRAYQVPEGRRGAKGTPLRGLVELDLDERVTAVVPLPQRRTTEKGSKKPKPRQLLLVTRKGLTKRMEAREFASVRPSGIRAIKLVRDDEVAAASLTDGNQEVLLITRNGQAIRFHEDQVRIMGRAAAGVRAMRLAEGDAIVSVQVFGAGDQLLVVTQRGFGKRTPLAQFNPQGRGGGGVRAVGSSERSGGVATACLIKPQDEAAIVTAHGVVIRLAGADVPSMGRSARGAKLVGLGPDDVVASATRIPGDEAG